MSTLHLVSHTHWDREWYLTYQQFRLKLVHMMDHLLRILREEPNFQYFLLDGQTIILEDFLELRPELESELVRRVAEGRILIGPWYISPDEFLVAPEAHIRNLSEGNRICKKFGKKMLVGYLPDSFGHIGQMPQILRGFGIENACLWRGLDDQLNDLLWVSPDGSSVSLAFMRNGYSHAANLTTSDPNKFSAEINNLSENLEPYSLTNNILLMHGADHTEPSVDLVSAINTYQNGSSSNKLIQSNLPAYFESVREELTNSYKKSPEVKGELRTSKRAFLLPNVLSTRIWIKQRNQSCENDLLKWVEPLSAWVSLVNQSINTKNTPSADRNNHTLQDTRQIIHFAWNLLMQCHPHDSICGTTIDQVADEMHIRFDQVDQINKTLIDQSLEDIGNSISTSIPASLSGLHKDILASVVIFNPNGIPGSGLVSLKYKLEKGYSSINVVEETGRSIPINISGMGSQDLISMVLDKKGMQQALGMVPEGNIVGMTVRDFVILRREQSAMISVTLSDHGEVDKLLWRRGVDQIETLLADPQVNEFFVQAKSDPEISLSMLANGIPSHGYSTYWIQGIKLENTILSQPVKLPPYIQQLMPLFRYLSRLPVLSKLKFVKKSTNRKPTNKIENEFLIVEVNPSDGTIIVKDKRNGQNYPGLNRFVDGGDRGDVYNYCSPEHDHLLTPRITGIENKSTEIYHKLLIHYSLSIPESLTVDRSNRSRHMCTAKWTSEITMLTGIPRVDIRTELDNLAKDHRLRVHFPAPFSSSTAWQEGHFEIVNRPTELPAWDDTWAEPPRPEVPQREFTCVANERISLLIANRGLPEVEVHKNTLGNAEIALTLVRSIGWLSRDDIYTRKGHAGPMGVDTPGAQCLGKHIFEYSIIPGEKDWHPSIHLAHAFNSPMKVISTSTHPGPLAHSLSMIENTNQDFLITSIKRAEDKDDLIVRGYNHLSKPITINIKPWKIFRHAALTLLDETNQQGLSLLADGSVNIQADGHKIITLRFSD